MDILSGCYWTEGAEAAHINILVGQENGQYLAAEPLLMADGSPLVNVPKTEDANDEEASEEEQQAGDDVEWNNICTHQHAVDYDNDGDLDLVTGNIGNTFFFAENTGSNAEPEFSQAPQKLSVTSPGGHSSPHLVDWDGDGDLDLLSGSANGGAYLSENTGSRTEPNWADFKTLIPGSNAHQQSQRDGPIVPAPATRLWVVDWNNDGKLDVLAGDQVTISDRKEGLSDEQFNALKTAYESRLKESQETYTKVSEEFYEAENAGEVSDELQMAYEEARKAYREAHQSKSDFVDERRTGHVWLYLQT